MIGQAGSVPPNPAGYGAAETLTGSDSMGVVTIDTPPCALKSDEAGEAPKSLVNHAHGVGDETPGLALFVRCPPVLAVKPGRVWKDDPEGNVAHGCAASNGIGDGEQLDQA